MTFKSKILSIVLASAVIAPAANAAYILEVDTDGLDDGNLALNSNFAFGGDTTTASSSITSTAFGTSGGDSIFGGDGASQSDTYVFTYKPGVDGDNLTITAGFDLGGGNLASGETNGGVGTYRIYATWPLTTNVSGGDTQYDVTGALGTIGFTATIDQNNQGNEWILLGDATITDPHGTITVTQTPTGTNSFVSMRAAALLFECVECETVDVSEPATLGLLGLGLVGISLTRRRKGAAI